MKIWVHLNGVQQGPYTFDQLQQLPVDPQTPVWYEGLPQWMPAGQAPATAPLFATQQPQPQPQPQPQQQWQPQQTQAGYQSASDPRVVFVQAPQRPATYLIWSILLTVLCCSPFSIIAIVTGAMVNSRYNAGNYDGARRMSNVTEWMIILSIVVGLIFLPISMLLWL